MRRPDTTISGQYVLSDTIANGNTSRVLTIDTQAFAPLQNVSKAFKYYRFRKLTFVVPPIVRFETTLPLTSDAGDFGLGYTPDLVSVTTTSITVPQVCSLRDSIRGQMAIVNSNITNNSTLSAGYPGVLLAPGGGARVLRVRSSTLRDGSDQLYLCAGTPGSFVSQGELIFAVNDAAGANTVKADILVKFTVDFYDWMDSSVLGLFGPKVVEQKDDDSEDEHSSIVSVKSHQLTSRSLAPVLVRKSRRPP